MIPCISVENMRQSDAYTIENFVPSLTLMYRAAWGVYLSHQWTGKTAIVVGSGNNGGDGFALACILKEKGYHCTVFTLSSKLSEDSKHYSKLANDCGVSVCSFDAGCLNGYERLWIVFSAQAFRVMFAAATEWPLKRSTHTRHSL